MWSDRDRDGKPKVYGKPFWAATFNLCIRCATHSPFTAHPPSDLTRVCVHCALSSAAGAGLLSYPYAMKCAGVVLTVIFTLIFAALNAYGLNLLARLTGKYYDRLKYHTYEELVGIVLGPRAYKVCVAFLLWNVLGAMSGFLIIIGDRNDTHTHAHNITHAVCTRLTSSFSLWAACAVASPPIEHALNCEGAFLCSRGFVILVVCLLIILPLSLLKDFHSLWFSSFLGVAGVIIVAIVIMVRGAADGVDHSRFIAFNGSIDMVYSINIIIFALGQCTRTRALGLSYPILVLSAFVLTVSTSPPCAPCPVLVRRVSAAGDSSGGRFDSPVRCCAGADGGGGGGCAPHQSGRLAARRTKLIATAPVHLFACRLC
jgi:hypothetical protein